MGTDGEVSMVEVVTIGDARWRQLVTVGGTVRTMRVQPWAGVATLELHVYDDTGGIIVVFTGRKQVAGVELGTRIEVTGRVGERRGSSCLLNPAYRILPRACHT